jgi:prepilin peptidase CpaA
MLQPGRGQYGPRMARTFALLILAAALATDVRRRTIPNVLTVPALAAVVAASGWAGGWAGIAASVGGAMACAGPLFVAAIPGWIGMGDVKLMAVAGAAAGWPEAVSVLLLVSLAGGVQAAAQLCWARLRGRTGPRSVPYACAIAAGSAAAYLIR